MFWYLKYFFLRKKKLQIKVTDIFKDEIKEMGNIFYIYIFTKKNEWKKNNVYNLTINNQLTVYICNSENHIDCGCISDLSWFQEISLYSLHLSI